MIIFYTATAAINLTHLGLKLQEESPWFTNDTVKSHSLPFNFTMDSLVARQLGLPQMGNIRATTQVIYGSLKVYGGLYQNAAIRVEKSKGQTVEAELSYGDNALAVYEKHLSDLNWPTYVSNTLLFDKALNHGKGWGEVTHQFPKIFRPDIKDDEVYQHFELFMNGSSANSTVTIDNVTTFYNRNVLVPCVFLLEILRHGYELEGKVIRGRLVDDPLFRKVCYVPENYFENFYGGQYDVFNFTTPDQSLVVSGLTEESYEQGVFDRIFGLDLVGTYTLKFDINLPSSMAFAFVLRISRFIGAVEQEIYFNATSSDRPVNLDEELEINISDASIFGDLRIHLELPYQDFSIEEYNNFEFAYKEGRQNVFPKAYTLAPFMPDMTFGSYVNLLKNWLNLDISVFDNVVYLDFVEDKMQDLFKVDKSHLSTPYPEKKNNADRWYALHYGDARETYVDRTGIVLSQPIDEAQRNDMDFGVAPLPVENNYGVITATYLPDAEGLRLCIYDHTLPLVVNNTVEKVNGQKLDIAEIYDRHWKTWLRYRTNSYAFKDKFKVALGEDFNLRHANFMNNELHLFKKVSRRHLKGEGWEVEYESEVI